MIWPTSAGDQRRKL